MMPETVNTDSLFVYTKSVVGKVRDHNEDSVYGHTWGPGGQYAVLAVADGMGGHARGEWASKVTIETLEEGLKAAPADMSVEDVLRGVAENANRKVRDGAGNSSAPPGTTLCMAVVRDGKCTIANVGDSRAYLMRKGKIRQLTTDDTLAEAMVEAGRMTVEQAENSDIGNILTESVGRADDVKVSITEEELSKRDVLLLCSDGLYNMVPNDEIHRIVTHSKSPMQAGENLCVAANAAGGKDNISVVLYTHGNWNPFTKEAAAGMATLSMVRMVGAAAIVLMMVIVLYGVLGKCMGSNHETTSTNSNGKNGNGATMIKPSDEYTFFSPSDTDR